MISYTTGQPIRSRLSPAELRESEIHTEAAQGPVPACLLKGYQSPPVTVRTATCAAPAPSKHGRRQPRHGRQKLSPEPTQRPLGDVEARRKAVSAQLADGAWRTVSEISQAIGLHPEVVRTTLRSLGAISRPLSKSEMTTRGALFEYSAAAGGPAPQAKTRQPAGFTHAFCEVCASIQPFREAPVGHGTDLVCSKCESVVATLYKGIQRPALAGAFTEGEEKMAETTTTTTTPTQPTQPSEPSAPSQPTEPKTPRGTF